MSQNLSSAAVVIDPCRVKHPVASAVIRSKAVVLLLLIYYLSLLLLFVGDIWASTRENLSSGVCEQQRHRPACASAQSDQRLCYSLIGKYHI